jgi:hypothetical protein
MNGFHKTKDLIFKTQCAKNGGFAVLQRLI